MRSAILVAAGVTLIGCSRQRGAGGSGSTGNVSLTSTDDTVSYIIGYQMGGDFKRQGVPANAQVVAKGIADGLSGTKSPLPDEQMRATMMAFQRRMVDERRHRDSLAGVENLATGEKFLSENKSKEGVKTSTSGLQWKVLEPGSGAKPKVTSTVTVHYRGSTLDGQEFDSSYQRGEPASFALNRVIPGWTEAIQLMATGSKYQFWIPSNLAYGPSGSPPRIGPNSVLVFEVELLSFK